MLKKIKKYDFHLLIWLVLLSFNIIEASIKCDLWKMKEALVIINLTYIISFYLQFSIISPYFLNRPNKIWLFIYTLSNIFLSLFAVIYAVTLIPFDACFVNNASQSDFNNFMDNEVYNYSFLFTTIKMNILIVLLAVIVYVSKVRLKQRIQIKELENKYLKNQISPHFLLNSLNNIYSLAVQKSEEILPQIENLSELLKYSLYKIQYDEIALVDEIEHIQLYLKSINKKNKADFKVIIEPNSLPSPIIKIKPLILFNFIENAVKHSRIESNQDAWIKLNIRFKDKHLFFNIQNSKQASFSTNSYSGIGLKNTKQRLKTFYRDNYNLEITETNNSYEVKLQIKLE